jgi:alkylation response protein AidB-like acyl-CoA dehydrogenase
MLQESSERFLEEQAPVAQLRALRDAADERGYSPAVWTGMVAQGWPGVAAPAEHGGSEFGQVGLGILMEGLGQTLSASPIEATVMLGIPWLLKSAIGADQRAVLRDAIEGGTLLTLAIHEQAHFSPSAFDTRVERVGDGIRINGRKLHVLDACIAQKIIVVGRWAPGAADEGRLAALLVDADTPGLVRRRVRSIDCRHVGEILLEDVVVPAHAMLGPPGDAENVLDAIEDIVAAQTAAQLLGLSKRVFAMTCDYLKSREQFGVKIGSFQALQHRAAQLFVELEMSAALVHAALAALDAQSGDAPSLASAAKAKLCRVSRLAVNEAVQMHGGIGVTDALDLGFYLKRAIFLQSFFGDAAYHRDRYARLTGY